MLEQSGIGWESGARRKELPDVSVLTQTGVWSRLYKTSFVVIHSFYNRFPDTVGKGREWVCSFLQSVRDFEFRIFCSPDRDNESERK